MQWIEQLTDIERKAILAATSHVTIDLDFTLSDDEFAVAEQIFNDLNAVQDGQLAQGYAERIPDDMHRAIWAAACAFSEDVHAPVDNLSSEDWDRLDALHKTLNMWGLENDPQHARPLSP